MNQNLKQWFRKFYNKITGSIAFYPALMAFGFLFLSWGMLEVDLSPWGKELKSGLKWLRLKDASTARSIISTVAGAVISLTVFSFSMVMIVLNQAASQMSNRVLTSMIENRFQQLILGFYIGTVVYALFLLSTIREISSGVYIPALSIYLLILMTIIDIFLFIYFLDYVTQTVKFETVIERVMNQTFATMKNHFTEIEEVNVPWLNLPFIEVKTKESNYFQDFDSKILSEIAAAENVFVSFLYPKGTFLLEGVVLLKIYSDKTVLETCKNKIAAMADFYSGQPIAINADYGFKQLAEIAIKGLSPGINDPGTAVIALQAITSLLRYRLHKNAPALKKEGKKMTRIYIPVTDFKELFEQCLKPIWNYGKDDQYIQKELVFLINQLQQADSKKQHTALFDAFLSKIDDKVSALGN
jgi:uncharacterized membrane protein